jgi:hypothetical protein
MKTVLPGAFLLLALAACSSGSGDTSSPSTVQGLATKLGSTCASQTPTIGAREEALCGSHSSTDYVDLVTFADSGKRDQWTKIAASAGGVMVVGPDWAAITNTQDRARQVVDKLGGKIN